MRTQIRAFAVGCAALLLSGVSDLRAQGWRTQTLRPMYSTFLYNQGATETYYPAGSGILGTQYPGFFWWGAGGAYGDVRISRFSHNFRAISQNHRMGSGIWYLTGDKKVVYTGIRGDSAAKIKSFQYNVAADPDFSRLGTEQFVHRRTTLKMGFGASTPDGSATGAFGNWWPGATILQQYAGVRGADAPPISIQNWNFQKYPPADKDHWSEEIVLTRWSTSQGLTTTRRTFGWSHPDFDDFYIEEIIVENTGDTDADGKPDIPLADQNNLFIGFQDRFAPSNPGVTYMRYLWEHERDWNMDDWFKYDPAAKLIYAYDGDHPLYNDWDDTGDPYFDAFAAGTPGGAGGRLLQTEGQILSFAHIGGAPLAYTNDPVIPFSFNARDRGQGYVDPAGEQPYAVRFYEVFQRTQTNDPYLGKPMAETAVYDAVMGPGRRIDPNPDHPSGQISIMLFGPYNLPPNGKLKIVFAYGIGHPGQTIGGAFENDPMGWARSSATVAKKQSELPKGLDALKQNIAAARFAYANHYDVPDAPPDVNFKTGSSQSARITVDWPDAIEKSPHPDYAGAEALDIAGYRVYRSTWFGFGPWELVADIPKGSKGQETAQYKLTYPYTDPITGERNLYFVEDKQSAAGFFYHYSVRAYAKGHANWTAGTNPYSPLGMANLPKHVADHVKRGLEGGWAAPSQRIFADESPFQPATPATDALSQRVLVVPNPYFLDDTHQYPGTTNLRFVGIPSKCRIRIFTVSGDLVGDLTHSDPLKGERDYNQIAWNNNGEIAAGMYIFVVENLVEGPNKGKLQRGAFVVVR